MNMNMNMNMNQPNKFTKGCLGCLVALIAMTLLVLVIVIIMIVFNPFKTPERSVLAKEMELTEEQEATMIELFDSCGIGEITSANLFQKGETKTSYYLSDIETKTNSSLHIVVWLNNETHTVEEIYFFDGPEDAVPIYVDGVVQGNIQDYFITKELRDTYMVAARMLVNQCLISPKSAEYSYYSWRFGVKDGFDIVQSEVTSKNAFGVDITSQFQVKFVRATGAPVSLIIDGQEYIK